MINNNNNNKMSYRFINDRIGSLDTKTKIYDPIKFAFEYILFCCKIENVFFLILFSASSSFWLLVFFVCSGSKLNEWFKSCFHCYFRRSMWNAFLSWFVGKLSVSKRMKMENKLKRTYYMILTCHVNQHKFISIFPWLNKANETRKCLFVWNMRPR